MSARNAEAAKNSAATKPAKKSTTISARILSDKAAVSALGTAVYYRAESQKSSAKTSAKKLLEKPAEKSAQKTVKKSAEKIPAELTIALVSVPPGCKTGWHHHPVPTAGYVIAGELAVEYENGEVRTVRAGQTMVEAQDIVHEGRNFGKEDAVVVVFHAGSPGVKNTVAAKKRPPKNNQPKNQPIG